MEKAIKRSKKERLHSILYLLMLFLTLPVLTGILLIWFRLK